MSDSVPGYYLGQKIKQWMGFQLWLQKKFEINLLIASFKFIFRAFQVENQYWFPMVSGGCLKENVVGMISWSTLLMHVCMFSCVWLFATLRTAAYQPPKSMGFPRQEYWSRLPFPPSGDLPESAIEPVSLASSALAGGFFTTSPLGEPTLLIDTYFHPRIIASHPHPQLTMYFMIKPNMLRGEKKTKGIFLEQYFSSRCFSPCGEISCSIILVPFLPFTWFHRGGPSLLTARCLVFQKQYLESKRSKHLGQKLSA